MDESLRARRDASLAHLGRLIETGRRIRAAGDAGPVGAWQRECAAAVHQLSGGSKAHWLSRAYGEALLVRAPGPGVVVEADPMEIVGRILAVLGEGAASLSSLEPAEAPRPPQPPRFAFVHDAALRPVLEQSFADAADALGRGEFAPALVLTCGVLEAVLTDALLHAGRPGAEGLEGWPFERRIAEAEAAGLVRGACSRLTPAARAYRELMDPDGALRGGSSVTEQDARVAGQVLRVVMRDLDPGR